jgi:hypothetical protein
MTKQEFLLEVQFAVQQFTKKSMQVNGDAFTLGYLEYGLIKSLMETSPEYCCRVLDQLRAEVKLISERK